MQAIIAPSLRAALAFIVTLILSRVMGRKLISQMTFFDFVVGVTIGSVAANLALGPYNVAIRSGVSVLVVLSGMVILFDFIHIKSFWGRKLVDSEPIVAVKNGQIVDSNLRKERFSVSELLMLLRQKNIFNLADVEYALLEADGKLSVLPKSQKQPLTPSDMNMQTPYKGLTSDLIYDGNIMTENLKNTQFTDETLITALRAQGVVNISDVFYAGLDSSGNLHVSLKNKDIEKHGLYGIE